MLWKVSPRDMWRSKKLNGRKVEKQKTQRQKGRDKGLECIASAEVGSFCCAIVVLAK